MDISKNSKEKNSAIISLRHVVQLTVCLILLFAGWHFHQFVDYVRGEGPEAARPPAAESFLPIARIIAFKALMFNGLFDTIHPAGLTIFLAAMITAFIFRRALCSWICPIGTLSEQLGRLGKRVLGKNVRVPKWLDIALLSIKYVIFLAIFWIFASMSGQDAISFMQAPFYSVSDIKLFDMFANLSVPGFLVIGFFTIMSIPIKSFWCRYLCPYGAFLGVIGLISPVILKKNDETCLHCGACNKACVNRVNVEGKKARFSPRNVLDALLAFPFAQKKEHFNSSC
jgi:polyferredoxin